jgi:hypothetical protein
MSTQPDTSDETSGITSSDAPAVALESEDLTLPKKASAKGATSSARPAQPPQPSGGGQIIDMDYMLWLATMALVMLALICLLANGTMYLMDVVFSMSGRGVSTPGSDIHTRLFELTALFSVGAGIAHFLRLRMVAMRSAAYHVPLPFRIVANPPGGDPMSKFECSCKVTLALDSEDAVAGIKLKTDMLSKTLDNAFMVAVTDPVIRFSKAKMEQTLKVGAHHILGDGVSGVIISDIKQRRIPRPAPEAANSDQEPLETFAAC